MAPAADQRTHPDLAFLTGCLALAIGLVALAAFAHVHNQDEFEHLHSAWYVKQGLVPYRDFYQHHHPLLWYALAPLLTLFGESANALHYARVGTFAMALCAGGLTHRIARVAGHSREAALLAVVLLLSNPVFAKKIVQLRPDVPQTILGLVSVWALVELVRSERRRWAIVCGASGALAFLFLQKAALLLLGVAAVLAVLLIRGRIRMATVATLAVAFLVPTAGFFAWIAGNGIFGDYLWTNWLVNLYMPGRFLPFLTLSAFRDFFFWVFAMGGVFCALRSPETATGTRVIAFLGLWLAVSLVFASHPYRHYYLPALPLLAVSGGRFACDSFREWRFSALERRAAIGLALALPVALLLVELWMRRVERFRYVERARHVLENTQPGDLVYDGNTKTNLFRGDLHYFWYSVHRDRGLEIYQRFIEPRPEYRALIGEADRSYDIAARIREVRPKFITDWELDLAAAGLDRWYEPTRFRRPDFDATLYVRREHPLEDEVP